MVADIRTAPTQKIMIISKDKNSKIRGYKKNKHQKNKAKKWEAQNNNIYYQKKETRGQPTKDKKQHRESKGARRGEDITPRS